METSVSACLSSRHAIRYPLGTLHMNAQHPYARELEEDEAALQDFLRGVTLLGIDERIRKVFGKEGGRLRATGMMVSDCDLLIGATALRHDLPLLTNNRRHFERIAGLCIE